MRGEKVARIAAPRLEKSLPGPLEDHIVLHLPVEVVPRTRPGESQHREMTIARNKRVSENPGHPIDEFLKLEEKRLRKKFLGYGRSLFSHDKRIRVSRLVPQLQVAIAYFGGENVSYESYSRTQGSTS